MKSDGPSYRRHRYPPQNISHAVWLYHRFSLIFRDVEDLLAERGIVVSYETIRHRIALFFALASLVGYHVFPWLGRQVKRIKAEEFEFSGLLMAALAYALFAEALGRHFILGAFLAGLFFVRRTIDDGVCQALRARIATFTTGFFAPLFFASIGFHLDAAAAVHLPLFVALLGWRQAFAAVPREDQCPALSLRCLSTRPIARTFPASSSSRVCPADRCQTSIVGGSDSRSPRR